MASHSRHVLSRPGDVRVQVKFRRRDLLWRHDHALHSPHAAQMRAWGKANGIPPGDIVVSVDRLPLTAPTGSLVGPTILDVLTRETVQVSSLPAAVAASIREAAQAAGSKVPSSLAVWRARNPDTLWPRSGQERHAAPREEGGDDPKRPDHPFLLALASGGKPEAGGPEGWERVSKASTVLLGEYAYRLAVGLWGGVAAAYTEIARLAEAAWEDDQARALQIWGLVAKAPGGVLVEDDQVLSLRPGSSVSQQVEREIMRQACAWLGIDPDLDVRRPRGRPRSQAGDEGEVVAVSVDGEGNVTGRFKRLYHGIAGGTPFSDLDALTLAEVLGALRQDALGADADLLEAYLDAADPDWREKASAAAGSEEDSGDSSGAETPYDVLGVLPTTPLDEVAAAFRAAMLAVQHLPNHAPQRRLTAAFKAVKRQRKQA